MNDFGAQIPGALRNRRGCCKRRAWYFQQKLRCWPQGAVNGDQGASRRDVECTRKLEKVLSVCVAAPDKQRNRQREAGPLAALPFRRSRIQSDPPSCSRTAFPHLRCQTTGVKPANYLVKLGLPALVPDFALLTAIFGVAFTGRFRVLARVRLERIYRK
jgi:hypothetical protein